MPDNWIEKLKRSPHCFNLGSKKSVNLLYVVILLNDVLAQLQVIMVGTFRFRKLNLLSNLNLYPAQKMKFSIKDFFSECDQSAADLVTFTEKILNGKLQFLYSVI